MVKRELRRTVRGVQRVDDGGECERARVFFFSVILRHALINAR